MRTLLMGAFLALVSMSAPLWAANYSDPVDGIFKGVYGDTISIEIPSQVSKSPVVDADQNGDVSFKVNSNTGYKNFNQLTDLKYGDSVRVDYTDDPTDKTKKMIANSITKLDTPVTGGAVTVVSPAPGTVATAPAVTQTVVTTTTRANP